MALADRIKALVKRYPGLCEAEMADALSGDQASRQSVNATCRRLILEDHLQRQGRGGPGDSFRYYLPQTPCDDPRQA